MYLHIKTAITAKNFWHLEETSLKAKSKISFLWHAPFFVPSSHDLCLQTLGNLLPNYLPTCCAPSLLESCLEMFLLSLSVLTTFQLSCSMPWLGAFLRLLLRLQDKICSPWKVPLASRAWLRLEKFHYCLGFWKLCLGI